MFGHPLHPVNVDRRTIRRGVSRGLLRKGATLGVVLPLLLMTACGSNSGGTASQTSAEQSLADQRAEQARVSASIEAVLQADAQTSSITDYAARVAAMRAIDVTGCPADFRAAYLDHIFAWEHAAKVQQAIIDLNSDDTAVATMAASAISSWLKLGATPILDHIRQSQRLDELRDEANGEVRSTFERVQLLATGYGATLPS